MGALLGHLSRKGDTKLVTAACTKRKKWETEADVGWIGVLDSVPSVLILLLHVASTTTLHGAIVKNCTQYNNNNITVAISHFQFVCVRFSCFNSSLPMTWLGVSVCVCWRRPSTNQSSVVRRPLALAPSSEAGCWATTLQDTRGSKRQD